MKKLFAIVAVAGSLALASCNGGDSAATNVDSTKIKDSIDKAQAQTQDTTKVADTTAKVADTTKAAPVKK